MSLLVVGSLAFDSVQTPHGRVDDVLGGSAAFFSFAASYFTPVRLVGVVGEDFPAEHRRLLESRNIDVSGLKVEPGGRTFRWKGRYEGDMNSAETLEVHLNVFGSFKPEIPQHFHDSPFVFLANGSPATQMKVLEQTKHKKLAVADTMNLWIETQHDELLELLRQVDGLVLNDGEARLLTEEVNLVKAGRKIMSMGPKFVVIKKGEHGSMFINHEEAFVLPAFPLAEVVDPTGAGDTFAGGMMGWLASADRADAHTFKRAMAYGTVVASYTVQDFSLDQLKRTNRSDIDNRLAEYQSMLRLSRQSSPFVEARSWRTPSAEKRAMRKRPPRRLLALGFAVASLMLSYYSCLRSWEADLATFRRIFRAESARPRCV